jgi:hypothetical protein
MSHSYDNNRHVSTTVSAECAAGFTFAAECAASFTFDHSTAERNN